MPECSTVYRYGFDNGKVDPVKFACVGAGPAGLYFSILMKQAQPDSSVVVFERSPRHHVVGWGMGLWDDMLRAISETDAETGRRLGRSVIRWQGQHLMLNGEVLATDGGGYGINRRTLLEILVDRALEVGVEIRFQHGMNAPEQLQGFDVVVAADGVNSSVRGGVGGRFGTEIKFGRNKYVWLGSDMVFDAFTFAFEQTDSGWIWSHSYAIDPQTSVCIVECPPETWRGLSLDTLSGRDSLRLLESVFGAALDGHKLLNQGRPAEPLSWCNFRTITNRRWWAGNTVLIGDAAHTAHFSIGSGTKLALQDAILLADCLSRGGPPQLAFAAYEKRRRRDVSILQRDAGFSSEWLEAIERYGSQPAQEFFTLLRARRDPLLGQLPPALYYRFHAALERHKLSRNFKSRVGPKARRAYGQLVRRSP